MTYWGVTCTVLAFVVGLAAGHLWGVLRMRVRLAPQPPQPPPDEPNPTSREMHQQLKDLRIRVGDLEKKPSAEAVVAWSVEADAAWKKAEALTTKATIAREQHRKEVDDRINQLADECKADIISVDRRVTRLADTVADQMNPAAKPQPGTAGPTRKKAATKKTQRKKA